MKRTRTSLIGLAIVALAVMMVSGCNKSTDKDGAATDKDGQNPIVTLEMESGIKMEIELYPDVAPNTVTNFVSLVGSGYYDGLIFHRIMAGFMIQGGDPDGTGMGGPGYSIKGEFSSNGFTNDLAHVKGVISMARTSDNPDSAGSQFFIMTGTSPNLDGDYAAFGKVIKGIEGLDIIGNVKTGAQDRPIEDQLIKKMTVDTFGVEYGEPEKITP
ncbi:MAG: peptidylprolyl isomerase [Paenibacillaceae bacterium]